MFWWCVGDALVVMCLRCFGLFVNGASKMFKHCFPKHIFTYAVVYSASHSNIQFVVNVLEWPEWLDELSLLLYTFDISDGMLLWRRAPAAWLCCGTYSFFRPLWRKRRAARRFAQLLVLRVRKKERVACVQRRPRSHHSVFRSKQHIRIYIHITPPMGEYTQWVKI